MMWGGPTGAYGYGYGMGFLGIALMAVFWIAIVVGVVLLVRWLMAGGTHAGGTHMGPMHMGMPPMAPPPGTSAALDILKERYAKGEITKEQFDQMKKDLEG